MGLRVRIVCLSLLLATPVAAGVLPLEGAYGDEAGCRFYLYGTPPTGPYLLLTQDTMASPQLSCAFQSLVRAAGRRYTVEAVCSPGGRMQLEVSEGGDAGYAVVRGALTLGPALACPDVPADPKGTVRS